MKHGYLKYCSLYKRWSTFGCKQKRFHLSITFWYIVIDFHVYCDRHQPVFRFRWVDFCNVNSTCLIFCLHLSKLLFDRCLRRTLKFNGDPPPLWKSKFCLDRNEASPLYTWEVNTYCAGNYTPTRFCFIHTHMNTYLYIRTHASVLCYAVYFSNSSCEYVQFDQ